VRCTIIRARAVFVLALLPTALPKSSLLYRID
jgi:hypothetical protein